ncbi:hypothetical protein Tco_0775469 [Tanacetum coccineum]
MLMFNQYIGFAKTSLCWLYKQDFGVEMETTKKNSEPLFKSKCKRTLVLQAQRTYEKMDIEVALALLSMRTRRFFQKTGRKITIRILVASEECRGPRNQDNINRNQDSSRRTVNVEETSSKATVAIDGAGSQIPDKSRKGVGFESYNVVPPPPTGLFSPPKFDLSNSGLGEFQQPEFEGYGPILELVSNDKKKTVFPTVAKIEFVRPKQQEKPVRKPVKYAECKVTRLGKQRKLEYQSPTLGSDFVMYNKACFVSGSFDHVQAHCNYHQRERVVSGNNYTRVDYNYFVKKTHSSTQRNMVPRAVLMKTGLRSLNTARHVNTAHPKTIVHSARLMSHFSKLAQSTVKRVIHKRRSSYVDSDSQMQMTGNMSSLLEL